MPETAEVDPVEAFLEQARLDPDYFECPTYHCFMLKSDCILRRGQALESLVAHPFKFGAGDEGCRWCRLGAEMAGVEFAPPPKYTHHIMLDSNPARQINKKVAMLPCLTPGCLGVVAPKNKSGLCSECAKKAFDIVYRKRDRKARRGES